MPTCRLRQLARAAYALLLMVLTLALAWAAKPYLDLLLDG